MKFFTPRLVPSELLQNINPWSWTLNATGNVFAFINLGRSSDPEMEREILDRVGSYGRQLGRIGDALKVIIDNMDRSKLSEAELEALRRVMFQLDQIKEAKEDCRRSRGA